MRRALFAALVTTSLAAPAAADVTIKQTNGGKGLGMSGTTASVTYIKGGKMRSETVTGDTTRTTVFDITAQKMYSFDSKKKEADVWNLADFQAEMAKSTNVAEMKASIKPNGQTRQIAGRTATGYEMNISVPTAMNGDPNMAMTVNLTGPVWIVKGAPGSADWSNFYKLAAEKGLVFGDPRAAKGNAGQANYSASKAGMIGFTKSMAKELASRNIRCNALAPGFIETEMTHVLDEKTKESFLKAIPLGRLAKPDEVSDVVVFLASEQSSYITGQVLSVCGGMNM